MFSRRIFESPQMVTTIVLTSSNVHTVTKMCSRWYRSQFNNVEKAWVRVEILCFDFRKTRLSQYIKSRKVATFKNCEIFSSLYFSYVHDYKATLLGGNNKNFNFCNISATIIKRPLEISVFWKRTHFCFILRWAAPDKRTLI